MKNDPRRLVLSESSQRLYRVQQDSRDALRRDAAQRGDNSHDSADVACAFQNAELLCDQKGMAGKRNQRSINDTESIRIAAGLHFHASELDPRLCLERIGYEKLKE